MLTTPLGTIEILINEKIFAPAWKSLSHKTGHFVVDGCFATEITIPDCRETLFYISCQLSPLLEGTTSAPDTGEDLAMITMENQEQTKKVSIGTIGDIDGVIYLYERGKLTMEIPPLVNQTTFPISVAWIANYANEDVSTFFAADPTIFH